MKEWHLSSGFKSKLKGLLEQWRDEGIIEARQAETISSKYGLENLSTDHTNLIMAFVYGIGAALLGIGVISFVAFNWDYLGPGWKTVIIYSGMLIVDSAGFYLWKIDGRFPRLGHCLVVVGTIIFGANIGLVAQIFHIHGHIYNGFLAWAAGAVAAAYLFCSVPNAILAAVAITGSVFSHNFVSEPGLVWYYPVLTAAALLPFAYWRKSSVVFVLSWIVIFIVTPFSWGHIFGEQSAAILSLYMCALACIGTAVISGNKDCYEKFKGLGINLSFLALGFTLFLTSFHEVSEEIIRDISRFDFDGIYPLTTLALPVFVTIILILGALWSLKGRVLNIVYFGIFIVCGTAVPVLLLTGDFFTVTVGANTAILLLCGMIIYRSVVKQSRLEFWGAGTLLIITVIARTLEYETNLLLKSIIFAVCGASVMLCAFLFEKILKRRSLK